jgi:hypothetical protein
MAWTTAVEPKPLSWRVQMGLDWLVEHQLPGGGWGEGEESARMGVGFARAAFRGTPDVADTCIASLALIRSGSTPREGPYRGAIVKGVQYVRTQVEASDAESLAVASVRGTRVQGKLGPNIDTYLASMLLAEAKGRMPDRASEAAVDRALDKVIGKIERHLAKEGPSEGQGWAPILAQAMSAKGLNRARQAGARVSDTALAQTEDAARMAFKTGDWPIATDGGPSAYEMAGRSMAMGHARTGHKASRRPMATGGAGSADEGSSRSMAAGVDNEEAGDGSVLSAASPIAPSSAAGGAARDGASVGRRSMLAGGSPAPPSPAERGEEDAGRRSMLAGGSAAPSSAAAGGEAKDGEDVGRRLELSAASPVSPLRKARRRMGGAAGRGADTIVPLLMGGATGRGAVALGPLGPGGPQPGPAIGGAAGPGTGALRPMMASMAAGVPLYGWSACLGILQDSLNTGRAEAPQLRDQAARSRDPSARAEAMRKLDRIADTEMIQQGAQTAVVALLYAPRFLAGVGSNGGEEFLSYMTLAESLVVKGGDEWRRWDSGMTENLYRVQNADGSWSGSHCITGRTFCTSAALLTLMADRTPVPVPARATASSSSSR